ncbi:hypothetical protein scyTo_0003098, partial [Scyliorhinus torazame]|nr:hypothetical protein [Scyliorhinus torazame]
LQTGPPGQGNKWPFVQDYSAVRSLELAHSLPPSTISLPHASIVVGGPGENSGLREAIRGRGDLNTSVFRWKTPGDVSITQRAHCKN